MNYRGYEYYFANPTGGKAGKGRNKTSTIRVFDGDRIVKQQRYTCLSTTRGAAWAIRRIQAWIDKQIESKGGDNAKSL